jgi:hypothetical protein
MGFADAWLGTDPKILVKSFLTDEQQDAFRRMLAGAEGGLAGVPDLFASGWPTFDREAPGPNLAQQLSLAGMEEVARGGSAGVGGGIVDKGRETISNILGRDPTDFDEFFRTNVEDPLMEALTRPGSGGISTMKKAQVGSGNLFGSEYQKGVGRLFEDVYDTMGRERARMALDYRAQDTQDQLAALGMMPQIEGIEPMILGAIMQSADVAREGEMEQYGAEYAEFMRMIEEAWRRKAYASGLATAQTTATTGAPGKQGVWETFLHSMMGGAGQAAGKPI